MSNEPWLIGNPVERAVVDRQSGQRGGNQGHPVIALLAGDDLLLVGLAQRVHHVPDQLDLGVVGLGARGAVDHPRHRDRVQFLDLLGQLDGGLVGAPAEQVVIGQLAQLFGGGVDQFLVAKAQPAAPEARQPLDEFPPLVVMDIDPFAALDQMRADLPVGDRVGIGV
jgi:hypothetical protein